ASRAAHRCRAPDRRDALVQPAHAHARLVDGFRRRAGATRSEPAPAVPGAAVSLQPSAREARVSESANGVAIARTAQRAARICGVLIIVETLPCPFDRRVMQEARTLTAAGYAVSIICPKAPGYEKSFEPVDGIDIHRHTLPREADGALGYALEYGVALLMEFWLSLKILFG